MRGLTVGMESHQHLSEQGIAAAELAAVAEELAKTSAKARV